MFRRGGPSGTQPPLASKLLVHPNTMRFGTGLRTFLLKICRYHIFLTQKPSQGSSPLIIDTKKAPTKGDAFFLVGHQGLEPRTNRL